MNAMNADRLTDERIREAVRNTGLMFTAPDMQIARAIESAVRSHYEADLRQAREALSEAHTGLMWYRGVMPEYVDGSDDEADERILAALAALDARLGEQRETAVSPAADPQRNEGGSDAAR